MMFGLFEAFAARIDDQSREFDAALTRVASRRVATSCDPVAVGPVVGPELVGTEPATTDLVPPPLSTVRRPPAVRKVFAAAPLQQTKPKLNFA